MAQESAGAPPCPACGGTVYGYNVKVERDGVVTVTADCASGSCSAGYFERFTFPAWSDGVATTEDLIAAHRAYRQTEQMHAAALAQVQPYDGISYDTASVIALEQMLMDVLDCHGEWYEIQEHTGLPEARCKEIADVVKVIRAARTKKRKETT